MDATALYFGIQATLQINNMNGSMRKNYRATHAERTFMQSVKQIREIYKLEVWTRVLLSFTFSLSFSG